MPCEILQLAAVGSNQRAQCSIVQALCTLGSLSVRAEEGRLLLSFTQGSNSFREILREAKGVSKASHEHCLRQLRAQSWDLLHIRAAPDLSLLRFDSSSLGHDPLSEALTSLEGQHIPLCSAGNASALLGWPLIPQHGNAPGHCFMAPIACAIAAHDVATLHVAASLHKHRCRHY